MLDRENIYLIGIGGIGMSALARYFVRSGKNVAGYDRVRTDLCEQLESEGMDIHYEDAPDKIPAAFRESTRTLVIYTPAVPADHRELQYFSQHQFELVKRAGVLGMLAANHTCLAVAGTHGKTTTSALLAHIFKSAGTDMAAFLGGISSNYGSNFLGNTVEEAEFMVVEADEYDRSFLQLSPSGAIITSMDADHLDIYGNEAEISRTFSEFADRITQTRIIRHGLPVEGITYGLDDKADYAAHNLRIRDHRYYFDLKTPYRLIRDIRCGLAGRHNVENAAGAAALALEFGISPAAVQEAIATFTGVKRRFEYHVQKEHLVYIDDYAHHPREIEALLSSVRELYPGYALCGIFQPHLFSRTRDFADDFARSLEMLDELILMEIYPAREKPLEGINSAFLLEKVKIAQKSVMDTAAILSRFRDGYKGVVLTIGAGDIDRMVSPLKNVLEDA